MHKDAQTLTLTRMPKLRRNDLCDVGSDGTFSPEVRAKGLTRETRERKSWRVRLSPPFILSQTRCPQTPVSRIDLDKCRPKMWHRFGAAWLL